MLLDARQMLDILRRPECRRFFEIAFVEHGFESFERDTFVVCRSAHRSLSIASVLAFITKNVKSRFAKIAPSS